MNLNEECLLNYLKNPEELNKLSALIGEYFLKNISEIKNSEYSYVTAEYYGK